MHELLPNRDDIMVANLPVRKDPWYQICLRAQRDRRFERVRDEILEGRRAYDEGRMVYNMDGGPFFHDTRSQSIITLAAASVTGATTDKLVHPASLITVPQGYFIAGKKLRMTLWVAITSGTTPGNMGIEAYVGSADASGTLIVSSTVAAVVATQTSLPVKCIMYLTCRGGTVETAKPVECYGEWLAPTALVTAANQQASNPIPISAPANVNIDNTLTTLGFNIQFKNSGANANSYVTRDLTFEALT